MDCGAFGIAGIQWLFHKPPSHFARLPAPAGDPGFGGFQHPSALLGSFLRSCVLKGACRPGRSESCIFLLWKLLGTRAMLHSAWI